MKYFLIALMAIGLSGCQMFGSEIDRISGKIGDGVDRYCAELDSAARARVRDMVNPTPGGASIAVTCPGDA